MNEIKGIIMLVVLPLTAYLTGCLLYRKKSNVSIGEKITFGSMGGLCLFEILSVPLILSKAAFHVLFWSFSIIQGIVIVLSIIFCYRTVAEDIKILLTSKKNLWCFPAFLLVFFQLLAAVKGMHIDNDDAFYLGTTMTTLETDTMFQVSPYTGLLYETLPFRYILSPFPVYLSVLSKWFCLHPAILAHTVWPVLAILFSYVVYFLCAKEFFKKSELNRGIFLFLIAMLHTFSYYSVYSSSTFLLIRSWQGKAVLAGCILPMLFYALLRLWKGGCRNQDVLPVLLIELAAASVSSMGIFLMPLMTCIWGIACWLHEKKQRYIWYSVIFSLPGILLGICYLIIRSGGRQI